MHPESGRPRLVSDGELSHAVPSAFLVRVNRTRQIRPVSANVEIITRALATRAGTHRFRIEMFVSSDYSEMEE